jgi:hypothetical protein
MDSWCAELSVYGFSTRALKGKARLGIDWPSATAAVPGEGARWDSKDILIYWGEPSGRRDRADHRIYRPNKTKGDLYDLQQSGLDNPYLGRFS